MIRPNKHSNPNQTVVAAALLGLSTLRETRIMPYEELRLALASAIRGGDALMVEAMSFLFLAGLVQYHPHTDSIEYVGR